MGTRRSVTILGDEKIKIVKQPTKTTSVAQINQKKIAKASVVTQSQAQPTDDPNRTARTANDPKQRGIKYRAVRAKVDKTKRYTLEQGIEMVKKLSYSSFVGSLDIALVLREVGITATVQFPYNTGKQVKAIVLNEQVLTEIEQGKLDFQVLVATPEWMPKLTKFAKILGPKGLMPNPKNGTLTNNPDLKVQELSTGKITLKTEKKAPLINCTVGKLDMPNEQLIANIQAILKAFTGKVVSASISPTMGPGVKLAIEK